jgi:hypothetical protein
MLTAEMNSMSEIRVVLVERKGRSISSLWLNRQYSESSADFFQSVVNPAVISGTSYSAVAGPREMNVGSSPHVIMACWLLRQAKYAFTDDVHLNFISATINGDCSRV